MSSYSLDRLGAMGGSRRRFGLFHMLFGILAILLFVQLVRLIWLVATPLGPVGDWRTNDVQVLSPQSRLALFTSFDPFFRTGPDATGNVVTSLQLTLYGIRMNEGSGLGSAILAGPDGVQESYAVGDEILAGVTLESVRFDHVIINRSGVNESLYLDQSVPAETVDPQYPVEAEPDAAPTAPAPEGQADQPVEGDRASQAAGDQAENDAKADIKEDDAP